MSQQELTEHFVHVSQYRRNQEYKTRPIQEAKQNQLKTDSSLHANLKFANT